MSPVGVPPQVFFFINTQYYKNLKFFILKTPLRENLDCHFKLYLSSKDHLFHKFVLYALKFHLIGDNFNHKETYYVSIL